MTLPKKTKIARFGFGAHVVSANHCFFVFFGTVTAFFGFLLVYFVFFGTVVTFAFKNQKKPKVF